MATGFFKRYRMEIDLTRPLPAIQLAAGFEWLAWDPSLLVTHAQVKRDAFVGELDSVVFPCLGETAGCLQLMRAIASRSSFVPEATWLVVHAGDAVHPHEPCGTIQGITSSDTLGSIQNVGVVPRFRRRGLARALVLKSLAGFQEWGLPQAFLEVTAANEPAVKLYHDLGFQVARTLFKVVENAPSSESYLRSV